MKLPGLLREPLVHFLAAGGALFVLFGAFDTSDREGRHIRLGKQELLNFMQGQAQVYDARTFDGLLQAMKPPERAKLVHDAALQEALYREGEALGIARADPLIRQRVVQQMRLLLMEEAAAGMTVTDAEVQRHFAANRQDYALPATVTFTHVFLPGAQSRAQAEKTLQELRARAVPFDQAGRYGERFLYQINYVDVGPTIVESQFGKDFANRVLTLPTGTWQGPVASPYGWHLVLISRREPGRTPPLADVAATVREDALSAKRQQAADAALDTLLRRYSIKTADSLGQ